MLSIKHVATITGLSESALRYYEKNDLIHPTREDNNYRYYTNDDIVAIKYIVVMKNAGFTLNEMKTVLDLRRSPVSEDCYQSTQAFFRYLTLKLDQSIQHLQGVRSLITELPSLSTEGVESLIEDLFEQGGILNENEKF